MISTSSPEGTTFVQAVTNYQPVTNWFTWDNMAIVFYILIGGIAFTRLAFSIRKIGMIRKNNPVEKLDTIYFVNTTEPGTPFSFFRWLFWNRKIDLHSPEGEQIFRHELFHIRQKHSIDIILTELITMFFWINPFFHLIKKEIRAIHEFLADRFAVEKHNKWDYAELLLMQALETHNRLVNPFFHNQIKRRIAMITSSSKPGQQYLRKVLVLPIAIMLVALFAFSYREKAGVKPAGNEPVLKTSIYDTVPVIMKNSVFYSKNENIVVEADTIVWIPDAQKNNIDFKKMLLVVNNEKQPASYLSQKTVISKKITAYGKNDPVMIKLYGKDAENGVIIFEKAQIIDTPPAEYYKNILPPASKDKNVIEVEIWNKVFEKVEVEATFPGGANKWGQYLAKYLDASVPVKNGAKAGTYTVIVQFVVKKDSSVYDVRALTNHGFGMEEEVITLIRKGPKWIPALQNGIPVNAYRKQPVTFVITDESGNIPREVKISPANPVEVREVRIKPDHPIELREIVVTAELPKDYNNTANWDRNDPEYMKWRDEAIREVMRLARAEGKAAYYYKGRTYVFAKIDESKSANVNSYFEDDGVTKQFILNGKLIHSIDEINSRYRRNDIKSIKLVFPNEAKQKYDVDGSILEIETFDYNTTYQNIYPADYTKYRPGIKVEDFRKMDICQLLQLPPGTEIKSFTFSIDTDKDDIIQVPNTGNELNSKIKSLMLDAKAGKLVTIDLVVIIKDGKDKKIPSRVYHLINQNTSNP
jgi:hypothetical protein